jgi:hypothetical protein
MVSGQELRAWVLSLRASVPPRLEQLAVAPRTFRRVERAGCSDSLHVQTTKPGGQREVRARVIVDGKTFDEIETKHLNPDGWGDRDAHVDAGRTWALDRATSALRAGAREVVVEVIGAAGVLYRRRRLARRSD